MWLKLCIKGWKKNVILNSLVLLLMVVVFIIMTMTVSFYRESRKQYKAIEEEMNQEGYYYGTLGLMRDGESIDMRLVQNQKELKKVLGKSVQVMAQYILLGAHIDSREANIWAYDDELLQKYRPSLLEGRWFDKKDFTDATSIYGVILDDGHYKVGDHILVTNWNDECPFEVEIIGVLKNNTTVIGHNLYSNKEGDYTDCYYTYNVEFEEMPLLIMSNDQLDIYIDANSKELCKDEVGISRIQWGVLFVTWEKECNNFDVVKQFMYGGSNTVDYARSMEEMYNITKSTMRIQVMRYLPIVLSVLILSIIGTLSASVISVKKQLHDYAIYYICGLSWKQCGYISLCHSVIICIMALFISWSGMWIFQLSTIWDKTVWKLGLWELFSCLILVVIFVGLSIILPMHVLKGVSAKDILREEI